MNVKVTSASKTEQNMSQVAAAVFVITQEDIRRSGATNIPDLLRMVPGVDVAQINANNWAVSARGFNGQFANKLLVLIDGRAVYTPLLGGVNWDTQDVPLENIDRNRGDPRTRRDLMGIERGQRRNQRDHEKSVGDAGRPDHGRRRNTAAGHGAGPVWRKNK